jgi:hypothetical protein
MSVTCTPVNSQFGVLYKLVARAHESTTTDYVAQVQILRNGALVQEVHQTIPKKVGGGDVAFDLPAAYASALYGDKANFVDWYSGIFTQSGPMNPTVIDGC